MLDVSAGSEALCLEAVDALVFESQAAPTIPPLDFIILYGHSLHSYSLLANLLTAGINPTRVVMVGPSVSPNNSCFDDQLFADKVTSTFHSVFDI